MITSWILHTPEQESIDACHDMSSCLQHVAHGHPSHNSMQMAGQLIKHAVAELQLQSKVFILFKSSPADIECIPSTVPTVTEQILQTTAIGPIPAC